jgi:AraC-like DNA-binding protein
VDISINCLGVDTDHEISYVCDRPQGHGNGRYLFMRFNTPVFVRTVDGIVEGEPDDCLIHDPPFPQYLTARNDIRFRNDWIDFSGNDVKKYIKTFHLPFNMVFKPRQTFFIEPLIRDIITELHRQELHWQRLIHSRVEELFMLMSRFHHNPFATSLSSNELAHLEKFRVIRMDILRSFTRDWNVEKMAGRCHLSANRFAVLYKKFFDISPMEDVLRARLNHAKHLLRNSHVQVSEVARQCGFSNVYYFSRLFRNRVGCTPSQFYRISTKG